jgi:hypothetical protein
MKNTLLYLFCIVSLGTKAQTVPATYAADFKLIFEAAKKYYKNDKVGEAKEIKDENFIKEVPCKTSFQNAKLSRLVMDRDEVLSHHVVFEGGATKEDALSVMRKFMDVTKPLLPPNFKESKTTNMRYADLTVYSIEYNSEIFAETAKRPSLLFGIIEKDGKFTVDIQVMAPVFTFD